MRSSWASVTAVPLGATTSADAGPVQRDHVHIALDHDQPLGGAAFGRGSLDVVERAALVEERRVGGVEILRLARSKDAPAKTDHPAARIANGEHEAPAEAIVGLAALLGFDQHPGLDQLVLTEFFERRA